MDLPRPHEPIAVVQQRPSDIVNSRLEAAVGRYRRTEGPHRYLPRIPGKGTVGEVPQGYHPEYPEKEQLEKGTSGLTVRMRCFRWLPRIPGWVSVVPATHAKKSTRPHLYIYPWTGFAP